MDEQTERARILGPRSPRMVASDDRRRSLLVRGRPADGWRDVYHQLLTMRWWRFGVLAAVLYGGINTLFGFLYWLDPHGLNGVRPGSFVDAFDFSVETLGTIGYGAISPRSEYANALVAIEAFLNIALTALATGLIFSRVSRPTARVMFASHALITTFDGRRVFMFRCANQRETSVLEAEITVNFAHNIITAEGARLRRFEEVRMERQRTPLFALSWQVMHVIDEASPFFGKTPEEMEEEQAEIVLVLSGTDPTFASRIHARHSYVASEIEWDAHYVDVIYPEGDGRWIVDYSRFHQTRPIAPPAAH